VRGEQESQQLFRSSQKFTGQCRYTHIIHVLKHFNSVAHITVAHLLWHTATVPN
jgi:hypothetical protein